MTNSQVCGMLFGKRVVHVKHDSLGQLHIYYDGNRPDMVTYNGATYRYVHSLQGDILGLQNGTGAFVVEYRYDAWGRQTSKTGPKASSLGTINPFRYRGYVLDEDVGLYYLRSRYYNPWWGRFISADSILGHVGGLLQHNLFAYCCNSPVERIDPSGHDSYAASAWSFVRQYGMRIAMSDGILPFGDVALLTFMGGAALLSVGEWIWNTFDGIHYPSTSSSTISSLSSQINWGKADKNHILRGSRNHRPHNWSMFGIDPNEPDAWWKLLPVLKKVADYGSEFSREASKAGGETRWYTMDFVDEAATVVMKLFVHLDGSIVLSDAWTIPY